jgi:hypothetical protein
MTNACGTCTACCRIFEIPELSKPAGKWCDHCAIGRGCQIYDNRPARCADFECLWLLSQKRADPDERLGPELRPDKCKVVFSPTTNDHVMSGITMPGAPLAWRDDAPRKVINRLVRGGMGVVVGPPRTTRRTMIDKNGEHEVRMTEPDHEGMMYNIE